MVVVDIILFLFFCVVLVISGSFLVKSLVKIASFLRLSEFVVGFIIMAFATSIPELFVGITAAMSRTTSLALGTVIGSNIADLALVMGITIILARSGINVKSKYLKKDTTYMFLIALLPLVLIYFGNVVSRNDGVILLFVFAFYVYRMLKRRSRFTKEVEDHTKRWEIVLYVFVFIISLFALYMAAEYTVTYAIILSLELALPTILIGLFLVALGTSLPELIFNVRSIVAGYPDMALGDIIGSVVANSTLVVGVTALIYPITADWLLFWMSAVFMMIITFLFMTFTHTGSKLRWQQGVSLILLYAFFIMVEFYTKTA